MKKFFVLILFSFFLIKCQSQKTELKDMEKHTYTNKLINETSPYLLQHAHNPVNWYPWSKDIFLKAQEENKLLIISVGYAACHWCHVMEHESFEDTTVAKLMNDNFISVKIDREERPDVDQVYMTAIQLMTGRGGWPMNVIALPDGRPVWGGTYFPKEKWMSALDQLAKMWKKEPEKLVEYANDLTNNIRKSDIIVVNNDAINYTKHRFRQFIEKWERSFDKNFGGNYQPPKFPLPNDYSLLLRYAVQASDNDVLKHVENTLTRMALGGIYDQIGGGFARYSTDAKWHIPHFEKMLYDNAQLVSLYSNAYLYFKNKLYQEVVYETLDFIERELTGKYGNFYSSLDADSENQMGNIEEGAYYVWRKDTIERIISKDFSLFKVYYNINNYGKWENGNYVLIKKLTDKEFSEEYNISLDKLKEKVAIWKKKLLAEREKRKKPRLDDKTLTSWNALMLKGYLDAYKAFGDDKFLEKAIKNAEFIQNFQLKKDGGLYHNFKNGHSNINGYLEDFGTVIDAFIDIYQLTFNEEWLFKARELTEYCFEHYFDKNTGMFYFTSDEDIGLISRKIETYDGVIASSNSLMANNLYKLSHYFGNKTYKRISEQMLKNILPQAENYPSGFSNWLNLYSNLVGDFFEIAITGQESKSVIKEINKIYFPNKIIAGSEKDFDIPLLKDRFIKGETLIYVCLDGACKLPVKTIDEMKKEIKINF